MWQGLAHASVMWVESARRNAAAQGARACKSGAALQSRMTPCICPLQGARWLAGQRHHVHCFHHRLGEPASTPALLGWSRQHLWARTGGCECVGMELEARLLAAPCPSFDRLPSLPRGRWTAAAAAAMSYARSMAVQASDNGRRTRLRGLTMMLPRPQKWAGLFITFSSLVYGLFYLSHFVIILVHALSCMPCTCAGITFNSSRGFSRCLPS